ncbi:hypothetical protein HK102_000292 [Quaeritorhiza haematococci]|nr:hypothetical protein HK102_000292 [Quaeritorhiza haematococci]
MVFPRLLLGTAVLLAALPSRVNTQDLPPVPRITSATCEPSSFQPDSTVIVQWQYDSPLNRTTIDNTFWLSVSLLASSQANESFPEVITGEYVRNSSEFNSPSLTPADNATVLDVRWIDVKDLVTNKNGSVELCLRVTVNYKEGDDSRVRTFCDAGCRLEVPEKPQGNIYNGRVNETSPFIGDTVRISWDYEDGPRTPSKLDISFCETDDDSTIVENVDVRKGYYDWLILQKYPSECRLGLYWEYDDIWLGHSINSTFDIRNDRLAVAAANPQLAKDIIPTEPLWRTQVSNAIAPGTNTTSRVKSISCVPSNATIGKRGRFSIEKFKFEYDDEDKIYEFDGRAYVWAYALNGGLLLAETEWPFDGSAIVDIKTGELDADYLDEKEPRTPVFTATSKDLRNVTYAKLAEYNGTSLCFRVQAKLNKRDKPEDVDPEFEQQWYITQYFCPVDSCTLVDGSGKKNNGTVTPSKPDGEKPSNKDKAAAREERRKQRAAARDARKKKKQEDKEKKREERRKARKAQREARRKAKQDS